MPLFQFSAPAWSANLGEIYQMARGNDAKLAAAREAYKAGQEKLPQGRAGLLPNVSLSASYLDTRTESSALPTTNTEPYGYRLLLVQPLFRQQNLEVYEQGKIQALLSEQQLKLAEQELLLRVATAYFDVLRARMSWPRPRPRSRPSRNSWPRRARASRWARPPSPIPTRPRRVTTSPPPRKSPR